MPQFQFKGVDKAGKQVTGKIEMMNEGEVRMNLRSQGIRPVQITKSGALQTDIRALVGGGLRNVPSEVLVSFTRQLQVLIGAGIPLVQGLELLIDQTQDRTLKGVLNNMKERISQGSFLWEALSAYPSIFPKLYVSLVRAGEVSGSMEVMLGRLATYLEESEKLKKLIQSTMIYPVIVILIGGIVITVLMVFVIPKFEDMLVSGGQSLPLPTKIVIDVSHFFVNNILYIVGLVVVSAYITIRYVRSVEGRGFIQRLLFRFPIFGPIMQKSGVARFARTMQTLLSSGLNLIDAIDVCKATIDNSVLEEAVGKIRSEIESGKTLGGTISRLSVFPKMAVQMISVGEATGNLDKMLDKVAGFYEEEVKILVTGMTKIIEPLVLLFLGGIVGGLMIAMYMPIFKLAGSTQ